ncbi:DUF6882 domain-containing protein [Streptomyces sp. 4N509B]|uniref:DUF6882 domain-containing protein n=1 Tax=Streptomyces sp. 4N509B TaxID=3457413 RepID=UPI003FD48097
MNPHVVDGSFSDGLLTLARPRLAGAAEQLELFGTLLPPGAATRFDPEAGTLSRLGVTVRAQVLGSFARNGLWLWSWGNEHIAELPGTRRSRELRELGRREGVPELAEPLLDLKPFADPRAAAYRLSLVALGLLDGRGVALVPFQGSGPVIVLVDDPGVPVAAPRADRLTRALRAGAAALPGPALPVVRGWFARHGVEPEEGDAGAVTGVLACGDRVAVTLTADGNEVASVRVTGADGGAPASGADAAPEQQLVGLPTPSAPPHRFFPRELAPTVAREIAVSIRGTRAMVEYAAKELAFEGMAPEWDEAAGQIRFPGGGLAARRLGSYDLREGWFAWAPGTDDLRARFREAAEADVPHGASGARAGSGLPDLPELAADRLDLTAYHAPGESVAVALARTAASVAGHAFTSLGNEFFVVTDERLPAPQTGPQDAADEIEAGASWLGNVVTGRRRPALMRLLATTYFERFGIPVWHYGQPDFLSGVMGLNETRVYFGEDGSVTGTSTGMLMQPPPGV